MKIVSGEAMGRIDARAMEEYGIPGVVLMENAGLQAVRWVTELRPDPETCRIAVLCGRGNNGGDGFVMTRHLRQRGYAVRTWAAGRPADYRGDAAVNYRILERSGIPVHHLADEPPGPYLGDLGTADLIVDALLGTGLKKRVNPDYEDLIEDVNASPAPVLAVDVPSGIAADSGAVMGTAVRADYTVTFALPKRGLLLFPGAEYAGEVSVADIGIPAALTADEEIKDNVITAAYLRPRLPVRALEGHKGSYGRVLILAGSPGMTGAAALTGEAALRGGAGLVYAGTAAELRAVLESKLKEVISVGFPGDGRGNLSAGGAEEIIAFAAACQALAFGPGLDPGNETLKLLAALLAQLELPVIVDAGGLGALARDLSILAGKKASLVLTPHPGEFSRLTGLEIDAVQENRWELARENAARWQSIVVLKGAHTVVALPGGQVFVNPTGNPLLSSAGTGDVLTGLVTALAARGLAADEAALCGVYLHGLAADLYAAARGPRGALAGEISRYLPRAWNRVMERAAPGGNTGLTRLRPYPHAAQY